MGTKTCTRCNQEKPADTNHFHKYPRNADGLRGYCKLCVKDLKKEWEAAHPEQVREAKRRRTAANPEPTRNRAKQWRLDNPERYKENMTRWYEENKETVLAAIKEERKTNPDKFRNHELVKKFGITLDEFLERVRKQGGKCLGCGKTDPTGKYKKWVPDHDHDCCSNPKRTCGKCIRGILCGTCNSSLGFAKDNPQTLQGLAGYIEKYPKGWFLQKKDFLNDL